MRTRYDTVMRRFMTETPSAYEFVSPPLIRFGSGTIEAVGEVASLWGRRAWIVAGRHSLAAGGPASRIEASLTAAGIEPRVVATTAGEPTVDDVATALMQLPSSSPEHTVVVAVGGGATIDLAKAVAALATNLPPRRGGASDTLHWLDGIIVDHLEGVGRGLSLAHWPLPLIAIPTTAGTGAEATRNAVISCHRRRFKKSMRSPMMVPRAAIVDPDLTASCPEATVAASGLDCITQLIESFISRSARPLPRALAIDALPGALRALPRLLNDPSRSKNGASVSDRAAMSHAALVSGMALANAGLGMAHGVAAALGVAYGTPHGLACAVMLPAALRVNRNVAEADFASLERAVDDAAPERDADAADAFVERVERLCIEAGVPRRLSQLGVKPDGIAWLAENAGGSSMRGNPVELGPARLRELLAGIL